jgi:RNA polymerase sigma-70 factor (ECF subfamily)
MDRVSAPEQEPAPDPSLRAALAQAIDALPADLRDAFVVIEVFGLSYGEASTVLGVLTGTLKSRMHRARRLLVEALEPQEGTGEV